MVSEAERSLRTHRRVEDDQKARKCLRCSMTFASEWSGERICKRCKNSNAWRNGISSSFQRRGVR